MVDLWSAFLSCDARDMCRVGPALMRNHLALMAVALRFVTLWFGLTVSLDTCAHLTADVYWANHLDHPDYVAFTSLRDEADQIHRAWTGSEITDADARGASLVLTERLYQWEEQAHVTPHLFSRDEDWHYLQPCPPFRDDEGRLALLSREEGAGGGEFFCDYLTFFH
jgi:hypothetical protein